MPAKWGDVADKKLLLAMIHATGERAPKWNAIAALMDDGSSAGAISQRYTKVLKKQAQAQFGDAGTNGSPTKAKATPVKRGKKSEAEGGMKFAGSKRKAQKNAEEDDDEAQLETPSKKLKVKEDQAEESEGELV